MLPYHGKLINNEKDTDTSNSLEETRGHFAELKKKKLILKVYLLYVSICIIFWEHRDQRSVAAMS